MLSNVGYRMFESTRNAAAEPLKAARVFDNIVKAIEEAAAAAKKALQDVENATGMVSSFFFIFFNFYCKLIHASYMYILYQPTNNERFSHNCIQLC